ncbi:hypothetical protein [Desulfopila inferna]|uniref:hypothetical protein n=1 Tax=Desulfopila inferna TaxID=468528 RepID=UPI001965CD1C|nr:hypothetical protein [Desulfopila inferna]MBM9606028.1 hypothetical protein [Desulfopila inferna]
MKRIWYIVTFCGLIMMGGCGSLTGIPGHGGGKRFAVEQELVAAATRATIKRIDISALKGRKVNLYINAIDDVGSGNLIGGRFSLVSQVRGDYIHTPTLTEKSVFPRYNSTTTSQTSSRNRNDSLEDSMSSSGNSTETESSSSSTSSSTSSSSTNTLLAMPERKESYQKGHGGEVQIGVEYKGLGAYQNSEEIASSDILYLSGLLQTFFFLRDVHIVPPSEADIDVYVIIDVFGTVRTRIEWFLVNNEILRAKSAIEVMAVDHMSGKLVMPPQSASVEAEYNEQYILWAGPVMITKYLKESSPLLSDFTDVHLKKEVPEYSAQDGPIPYPFQYQIERWKQNN